MLMIVSLTVLLLATACEADSGLTLAPGWKAEVVTEWDDDMPDMIAISGDGKSLFITNETKANMLSPSLTRVDIASGKKQTLLYGLDRADGIKLDSMGSLWIGEEVPDGLIYKITDAENFPPEQRFDRDRLISGHADIEPVIQAGRMAHEGISFSRDEQYLYLADEWREGCLFRLSIDHLKLEVLHADKGWLSVTTPNEARLRAEVLHCRHFNRLEDLELLPDGRVLLAETGSGTIWILDDSGEQPSISRFFQHADLYHPDNLEWDTIRSALWITDDDSPSSLWLWDRQKLTRVASHRFAEITGVNSSSNGTVWFNLQHNRFGSDQTISLSAVQEP